MDLVLQMDVSRYPSMVERRLSEQRIQSAGVPAESERLEWRETEADTA
jgi:hypothetical protein